MKATATYRIWILTILSYTASAVQQRIFSILASLVESQHTKEKYPSSNGTDSAQGDGGVDVTGAPNSIPVEGAGFGQISSFSSWKFPLGVTSFLLDRLVSVIIGGSNFGAAGNFSPR